MSHDPLKTLQALQKFFKLKGDKIEEPEMYLGAEISKMQGDNGEFWTMSGENYVKTDVSNLEDVLHLGDTDFLQNAILPYPITISQNLTHLMS